jgi:glucose-1-phosphate cytidylyltransferase
MKTVLLAGGKGTRLSEETHRIPKPLVTIGGYPILWHIMQIYAHHGFREFCVALGYKGDLIKQYFLDYHRVAGNLRIDLAGGRVDSDRRELPDWRLDLIDTGLETMTAGRLRRLAPWLDNQPFMLTYGDGVSNVDIKGLVAFHRAHGKLATVTAVRPPARFGVMAFDGDQVTTFAEKPQTEQGWINGGFFVFEPEAGEYVFGDDGMMLERDPLSRLAADGHLMAYKHTGFWHPMDTLRDRQLLEGYWERGEAEWKVWA